eukprot:3046511-Pyramimonas_sp.AAC.1
MQLFTRAPRVGTHEYTVKEIVLRPKEGGEQEASETRKQQRWDTQDNARANLLPRHSTRNGTKGSPVGTCGWCTRSYIQI